jgi:Flp pilus assembly pilin Flp
MSDTRLPVTTDQATMRDAATIATFLWPWQPALIGAGIGAGGSLLLGLLPVLDFSLFGSLSTGLFLFFLVGGIASVLRSRSTGQGSDQARAQRWAAQHAWRYALMPAAGLLAVLFVAGLVLPGSAIGALFSGIGEALIVFVATGATAAFQRGR